MVNLKQCSECKHGTLSEGTLPFTFRCARIKSEEEREEAIAEINCHFFKSA